MIELVKAALQRAVLGRLAAGLAAVAVVIGLFAAATVSAEATDYTYDTVAYNYDTTVRLSAPHAPVEAGLISPAGPGAASGVSGVSSGRFGVAANGGVDAVDVAANRVTLRVGTKKSILDAQRAPNGNCTTRTLVSRSPKAAATSDIGRSSSGVIHSESPAKKVGRDRN